MTSYCEHCGEKLGIGNVIVSSLRKELLLLCYSCKRMEINKIRKTAHFFHISPYYRKVRRISLLLG